MGLALTGIGCDDQVEQQEPAERADVASVIAGPPGNIPCAVSSGEVAREIGPQGDSLVLEVEETGSAGRRHVLIVPPRAVSSTPIEFRLAHTAEPYVSVRATHQGAAGTFEPPLRLRLGYAGCNVPPQDTARLQLYIHENGEWQPVAGSVHHPDQQAVEAPRPTLSEYALGAG